MVLELHERSAVLSETVTVEEVEEFVAWLRRTPKARVSLRNCNHLHTAAFQAILVFSPKITAAPADSFLASQLLPALRPPQAATEESRDDDRDAG